MHKMRVTFIGPVEVAVIMVEGVPIAPAAGVAPAILEG